MDTPRDIGAAVSVPSLGVVVYRITSPISVDADGAPHCYAPPGSGLTGLDSLGSAKAAGGRWVGIVVGNDGQPVIQSGADPAPGYYVSPTALRDTLLPRTDPRAYCDASTVPYLAIGGKALAAIGCQIGDIGAVWSISTGATTPVIIADSPGGGSIRAHEMSLAAVRALGYDGDARGNGRAPAADDVLVLLAPGSRSKLASGWGGDGSGGWEGAAGGSLLAQQVAQIAEGIVRASGGPAGVYSIAGVPLPAGTEAAYEAGQIPSVTPIITWSPWTNAAVVGGYVALIGALGWLAGVL